MGLEIQAQRQEGGMLKGGGSKREREEGGKEEMAIERSKQLEKLSESRSIGLGSASITNTQT